MHCAYIGQCDTKCTVEIFLLAASFVRILRGESQNGVPLLLVALQRARRLSFSSSSLFTPVACRRLSPYPAFPWLLTASAMPSSIYAQEPSDCKEGEEGAEDGDEKEQGDVQEDEGQGGKEAERQD